MAALQVPSVHLPARERCFYAPATTKRCTQSSPFHFSSSSRFSALYQGAMHTILTLQSLKQLMLTDNDVGGNKQLDASGHVFLFFVSHHQQQYSSATNFRKFVAYA